jgi:hypothetical protein
MLKIGKLELELVKPDQLDDQLRSSTGCSAREVRDQLAGAVIAGHVASALLPFVRLAGETGPPGRIELAQAIAEEGLADVTAKVLEIYDAELGIEPPPMPEHLKAAYEREAAERAASEAEGASAAGSRSRRGKAKSDARQ